jgi:protein-tyrosine phosphatase
LLSLRQLTIAFPVLTLHLAMGLAFCGIALALAVVPGLFGGRTWLMAWPALSMLWVGVGYVWLGPVVIGKRTNGTFVWPAALLLMPYLAAAELAWYAVRVLGHDEPWQEVAHGLYLGRRVQHWELPSRVGFVLDMTAEFVEPEEVREGRRYVCVPTLDGAAPDVEQLARATFELLSFQGNVYVHCAAGYGRSATAMAVLLVARGLAQDLDHAIAIMQTARPRVRLRTTQRRHAQRVLTRLSELRVAKGPQASSSLAQST